MNAATQPLSAFALAGLLSKAGYTRGTPGHVTEGNARIDRAVCRRMKCPGCGRRGLDYRPWKCGVRYTVIAACPDCGAAEEL